ncbi:MAG: hypothetical protein ACPG7F_17085 [Aggregatilineales bacterium]
MAADDDMIRVAIPDYVVFLQAKLLVVRTGKTHVFIKLINLIGVRVLCETRIPSPLVFGESEGYFLFMYL